jgi:hypothetical protein
MSRSTEGRQPGWLVPAPGGRPNDVDGLHALACEPAVYRHLYDGAAPGRELIAGTVARAIGASSMREWRRRVR